MAEAEGSAGARELDVLYREMNKLYSEFARDCGLSDCAFWILYEVSRGNLTQQEIAENLSYSKQTVNSALKTLEARGLVSLAFAEGSRKAKRVSLTAAGRAFCDRSIAAVVEAESRAFSRLGPGERMEFVRLTAAYARAIDAEIASLERGGRHGG